MSVKLSSEAWGKLAELGVDVALKLLEQRAGRPVEAMSEEEIAAGARALRDEVRARPFAAIVEEAAARRRAELGRPDDGA